MRAVEASAYRFLIESAFCSSFRISSMNEGSIENAVKIWALKAKNQISKIIKDNVLKICGKSDPSENDNNVEEVVDVRSCESKRWGSKIGERNKNDRKREAKGKYLLKCFKDGIYFLSIEKYELFESIFENFLSFIFWK